MAKNFCCPRCGSSDLQVTTETSTKTTGKNYSAGQGCLGYLMFGPLGLLCGSCGQKQTTTSTNETYWACPKCGNKFRHPDELKNQIDSIPTSVFLVTCIIGAVLACFVFFALYNIAMELALFMSALSLGMCVLIGYLAKRGNDAQRSKLEAELNEIEHGMKKFKNE